MSSRLEQMSESRESFLGKCFQRVGELPQLLPLLLPLLMVVGAE